MFSEGLASDICVLWEHPTTKRCVERKNDIQVLDSGPYFLEKARQISLPDYVPSDEDVLRARSQTTGIITFKFEVKEVQQELFLASLSFDKSHSKPIRSYSFILIMNLRLF